MKVDSALKQYVAVLCPAGKLLTKIRVLSDADFVESAEIAAELRKPIEQVLVNSCYVTSLQLGNASRAHQYVEREILSERQALCVLYMACQKDIPFETALTLMGTAGAHASFAAVYTS